MLFWHYYLDKQSAQELDLDKEAHSLPHKKAPKTMSSQKNNRYWSEHLFHKS